MPATVQQHVDLGNRLAHHPPATEAIAELHAEVRARVGELAHWLLDNVPAGQHQSLALTAAQETMMWANAAVACDSPAEQPVEPVVTTGEQPQAE